MSHKYYAKYNPTTETEEIYAFASDGSEDSFIPLGARLLEPEEVAALIPAQEVPTPQELAISSAISIVQQYMDKAAQRYNYDDIATAVTYADEPSVPKFQLEGMAFRQWRSLVWAKCYELLEQYKAGELEVSEDLHEMLDLLPPLNLPEG